MPVAVRLRYVEDVYGKNAGAEQRNYYRQHTAAAAVVLFSHLAGHHVPAAVQYGGIERLVYYMYTKHRFQKMGSFVFILNLLCRFAHQQLR